MWFWAPRMDGFSREAGIVSKDEIDGTITGVLDIKALDRSDENTRKFREHMYCLFLLMFSLLLTNFIRCYLPGVLPSNGNGSPVNHVRRSSPKLRSRERFANGNALSHRSQTPPPLPKSASLPLHTKRGNHLTMSEKHSPPDGSFAPPTNPSTLVQPSLSTSSELRPITSPTAPVSASASMNSPTRSPSALFASSPLIADILRKLSASQNALSELRTQLSDFRSSSSVARAALEDELEKQKERKRGEDAARSDLKAQTKILEDQKRSAEAARREAEKRLKNVRSEKDRADARTSRLECEMNELHSQIEAQGAAIVASGVEASALVSEMTEQVETKKTEIRGVEEEIASLGLRVREMEEKVATEEKRLENAMEDAKVRKQNAQNQKRQSQSQVQVKRQSMDELEFLPSGYIGEDILPVVSHIQTRMERPVERRDSFPTSPGTLSLPGSPSTVTPPDTQVRHIPSPALSIPAAVAPGPPRGFSVFEKDINSHIRNAQATTKFSPFSNELTSPGPLSPTGESLIPSSLYESLGMAVSSDSPASTTSNHGLDVSRSFQSEDDVILDRNWYSLRNRSAGDVGQPVVFSSSTGTGTNVSPVSPAGSFEVYDPYDKLIPSQERTRSLRMETQRASFTNHPSATNSKFMSSDFPAVPTTGNAESTANGATKQRTGWFTSHKDKEAKKDKKGLNPDAKEFSLSKEKERSFSALLSRHRNSGGSSSGSGSNSNTSSTPSSASLSTPEPVSLISSPSSIHSIAVSVGSSQNNGKNNNSALQTLQHAPNSHSVGSWLSLGSWFGSSPAFAPTPLEREQLARVLGGSTNTSLDRLDHLSSLPPSPQLQQQLVKAGSLSGQGQGQGQVLQNKFSTGSLGSSGPRLWDGQGLGPGLGLGSGAATVAGMAGTSPSNVNSLRSSKSGFSPFGGDDKDLEHRRWSGSSKRGSGGYGIGVGVDELGFRA